MWVIGGPFDGNENGVVNFTSTSRALASPDSELTFAQNESCSNVDVHTLWVASRDTRCNWW
jgi:hypothetical protein